ETNTGPATDAGQYRQVLLAVMLEGIDVADDAGRGLELVKFLALRIDGFDVAFERTVEDHVTGRGKSTGPHRELLWDRPDDLTRCCVPGDKVAHAAMAIRRGIHRHGCAHIGLAGRVAHPVGRVVHADMVRRYIEKARFRRIGRRLLVLRAERGRAEAGGIRVFAILLRRILGNDLRTTILVAVGLHGDASGHVYRQ